MTTTMQVKRPMRPLLERHEDLALSGRWIFVKPVRHVLRGIVIDRTGRAHCFQPRWAVTHLCERSSGINLEWGKMIRHPVIKLWFWNDPRMPSALLKIIEEQTLPLLNSINTFDDFLGIANDPDSWIPIRSYSPSGVVIDVARGHLDTARQFAPELVSEKYMWASSSHVREIAETLCPLLETENRPGLAKVLHEWEAFTVKALGIEEIWEPTPFPLELQDDRSRSEQGRDFVPIAAEGARRTLPQRERVGPQDRGEGLRFREPVALRSRSTTP